MKRLLFIGICIGVFFVGFSTTIFILSKSRSQTLGDPLSSASPAFTPSPIEFELNPPKQSLTGKVIELQGEVRKKARGESDFQPISSGSAIFEDESLIASSESSFSLQFAQHDFINGSYNAIIAFPNTNPKNFLLKIDRGTVELNTDEAIATISARSLHALFSLSYGKAQLNVDPDEKTIEFDVREGLGTIGYIDKDNNTQVATFSGEVVVYDDGKREVK